MPLASRVAPLTGWPSGPTAWIGDVADREDDVLVEVAGDGQLGLRLFAFKSEGTLPVACRRQSRDAVGVGGDGERECAVAGRVAVAVEEVPVSVIVTPATGWPAPPRTTPANRKLRTRVTLMVVCR